MPDAPLASALQDLRVLDLSRLLPGPFLSMVLADLGADVVKVEDPRLGDYLRGFPPAKGGLGGRFLAINRGKRSVALDLKADAGRLALLRMVERADVVIESFRPGVLAKLGLGYDALRARNPGIVLCSISGYGQDGPYVHRAGHDLNYIALAGVLGMTGARDGAPTMPGVQLADLAGGALWGATGILAALLQRGRTGRGAHLDLSMTEGALSLLVAELGNLDCGADPRRGAELLNGGAACYGVYRTKDDRYLSVGALEPKFYLAFNRALGRRQDLAELAGSPAQQEATRAEIAAILAERTLAEWLEVLAEHDCCCEPVLEMHELAAHPLHQARGVFFPMSGGDGVGELTAVRTPLGAPRDPSPPPRLGQHSREVLEAYGLSADEIDAALAPPTR
ncbi:MAG: CaiB/BaiF CoA-transferase family protein [Kofleriaceae bacterium]